MIIPKTKSGNCNFCPAVNTNVVKRGKEYLCMNCKKTADTQKQIARQRDKQKIRGLMVSEKNALPNGGAELQRWFESRVREMKGICKHCGGVTQQGKSNYKCSIAHILPKAYFPSVATHPDNWIELCFYGKSCHTNLDNKMIDIIDLNCFDEVVTKFVRIYPFIATNEKRRIPAVLMQYIETEK